MLLIAKQIYLLGLEWHSEKDAKDSVANTMDDLRQKAIKNNPDLVEIDAIHKESIKETNRVLNSKNNSNERLKTSATMFLGFYVTNRARAKYCKELGVDISLFISAFEKSHINEYEKSITIKKYKRSDVDHLFSVIEKQVKQLMIEDIKTIAVQREISNQQACQLFNDYADEFVSIMHISVTNPNLQKILMEY